MYSFCLYEPSAPTCSSGSSLCAKYDSTAPGPAWRCVVNLRRARMDSSPGLSAAHDRSPDRSDRPVLTRKLADAAGATNPAWVARAVT